jgi:amino acid efflux transporter
MPLMLAATSWWIVAADGSFHRTFGSAFDACFGTVVGMSDMSTLRAVTLYVGALLGPSVLLLPGLAAQIAGPASILAWLGLLAVSGLLAAVFSALGRRHPGRSGAAGFAGTAFGPRAERAVAACFLAGVVLGAPVVCLIGAGYVAQVVGGGHAMTIGIAAVLLLLVVALTLGGGQTSAAVQLGLVAVLVVLVIAAVAGALPHAHIDSWTPFAPHGWSAIGTASTVLMLSFVGWEAIAPMTARLRSPERQLPRVIGLAFLITSTIYLALAATTVAVLGPEAGSPTPIADLLRIAIGPIGALAAAVAAVALTLAATNAYLSGATEMVAALSNPTSTRGRIGGPRSLPLGVAGVGIALLALTATGWVSTAQLVALPTTMFLVVYVVATAAGVRLLTGRPRRAAMIACAAVCVVLAFSGAAMLLPLLVIGVAVASGRRPCAPGGDKQASSVARADTTT